MATYSSKQTKSQAIVDPILMLIWVSLIAILIASRPLQVNVHSSIRSISADRTTDTVVSFTTDKQYWEANCSHGWNSDSTCENIVLRAQACYAGVLDLSSAYCTQYKSYVK